MTPELLLECVQKYNTLIGTRYEIHIGHCGKLEKFNLSLCKEDCHHLMGLHHLNDRPDRKSRSRIFDELLSSQKYRKRISESSFWTPELENRIICTKLLGDIIDDNNTIIRYSAQQLNFYSKINATYILENLGYPLSSTLTSDIYLFVDKRTDNSNTMFCKSIFLKGNYNYTENQTKWTLLYKSKTLPSGEIKLLYKHKNYNIDSLSENITS